LTRDVIARLLADLPQGPRLDDDLVTLWTWHNGSDTLSSTSPPGWLLASRDNAVFDQLCLPTLEQAVVHHRFAVELNQEVPLPPELGLYKPGWFPALVYAGGHLVCVDTTGQTARPGSVFVWDTHHMDPEDRTPWFPDLAAVRRRQRRLPTPRRSGGVCRPVSAGGSAAGEPGAHLLTAADLGSLEMIPGAGASSASVRRRRCSAHVGRTPTLGWARVRR
jgi:hypothetical protein